MKRLALTAAICGAMAFVSTSPVSAAEETERAVVTAISYAQQARNDLRYNFGRDTLANGRYVWKDGVQPGQVDKVVVSLSEQLAYAYRGRELVGASTISSGRKGSLTPIGIFRVLEKKRMHRSIKYDNAPMPFMQRIDQYGIALHAGHLPGRPASHGCVRLPNAFAAKLFAATGVGTHVLIAEYPKAQPGSTMAVLD